MKQLLKQGLLGAVALATRRTPVLLPAAAARDEELLQVVAPYRVEGDVLPLKIVHPRGGDLQVALGIGDAMNQPCSFPFPGSSDVTVDLRNGAVSCADHGVGSLTGGDPIRARRFFLDLTLTEAASGVRRRITSHYLPRDGQVVDERYYAGDDYVDYELQSESTHQQVVELVAAHGLRGPMLEVGCATGATLTALRAAGHEAFGLDFSSWAVERARERLGDAAWTCDVERDAWPPAVLTHGPFNCFVLAAVLEHFASPPQVLQRLTALAAPGAAIIIITTNASSFTHRLLGRDWEGYFDWTHKGVDAVTPCSLRRWLADLGWTTRELRTWHVWDSSIDPTHAAFRDWHDADARFRTLLAERELGDFICCVAVRS
jgi:2-polyprenyl-3-methyl-5-hydroxy-6-metoxy-1,4-benzoquinol methylase